MLLATVVLFFLVGLASLAGPPPSPWVETALWTAAGAATLGALSTQKQRPLLWFLGSLAAALGLGGLLAPSTPSIHGRAHRAALGGLARVQLAVDRSSCASDGCWSEGVLERCEELEPNACVAAGSRVGVRAQSELPAGATVTALGALRLRGEFRNPSPAALWPDVRAPLSIALRGQAAPRIDQLSAVDGWLSAGRAALRSCLEASLPAPHAGVARALLLGEGAAVEPELNDAIRNAGVSHVLAVSGMHVTLLAGALVWGARVLWLRSPLALRFEARRAAAALGALLAPLIARFCGSAPSAVRAAWTSALVYGLVALGFRPHPLAVTAFVIAAQGALRPHDALHPGFVLSVLATVALLTHRRSADGLLGAAWESVRAWLATAPFLAICFGQLSLIAIAANVALLPLGSALVPLAAVHAIAALLGVDRELATRSLFQLADGAFLEASRRCSAIDPGVTLPPLTWLEVVSLSGLALALMLRIEVRARALLVAGCLALALPSEWRLRHRLAEGELRVTFLDVGQGDSALLESGGRTALIDAGGSIGGGPDPGAHAVLPALRARRVQRLDLMVLSHPHPDHYGGLFAVLEAMPVGELWDTGQARAESEQGAVVELLRRARERGVRVREPRELCGALERFGHARLRVISPCPAFEETLGANDNSLVVRLDHGARSILFTGDIEETTEQSLRSHRALANVDVLKVAHHGSRTSSGAELLAHVRPWLAVISAGRGNRFGHPHEPVVARLREHVGHLLRTDVHGGIEVASDGATLRVRAWDPEVDLRRER